MTHKTMVNTSKKTMRHPQSGQIIRPGQQYMVPEDAEPVKLVDADEPFIQQQTVTAEKPKRRSSSSQSQNNDGNAGSSNDGASSQGNSNDGDGAK